MFRRLRSKIIMSFCLLMGAGGLFTTVLVQESVSRAVAASVDRNASALAQTLAVQLTRPLAYSDQLATKQILVRVRKTSRDIVYLFIVDAEGRITGHSFSGSGFPRDLLMLVNETSSKTIHVETGVVRDVSIPIAGGVLGTLHIGSSMTWAEQATLEAVEDVMAMTVLAVVVGIVGILILAQLITRPILALTGAARHMGKGGAFTTTPVTGRDEVAELAVAFNQLVAQVQARISESNELRAYVENVIDHLESSIIVMEESGVIEYANRTATEWHGDLVGQSSEDCLEDKRPNLQDSTRHVLMTGESCKTFYSAPSGRIYELSYLPMEGGDGRRMVIERASDITEQRQMADRLQRAERLAVAGELAAGIVHTINNPLDGVRRAIQLAPQALDDTNRTKKLLDLA